MIPSATSSIVDSADPSQCLDDGRGVFDGNGDGLAVCDRGAWEYRRTTLADGGANGLYADSDPNHNGHYVYVLDNNYNTLVIWNTFDTAGNQVWVFAIGQLVGGRSMIADAYINENGQLTGSGPIDIDRDNPWGTIQLELDSCESGALYNDLRIPPSNRLEALRGNRAGQHSIQINDQYRICFRWDAGNAEDVEIVDYH